VPPPQEEEGEELGAGVAEPEDKVSDDTGPVKSSTNPVMSSSLRILSSNSESVLSTLAGG